LQDSDRPHTAGSRLQLQSHSLSHSRTGQGHDITSYQLLFQYWTNFLMRKHIVLLLGFLSLLAFAPHSFAGELIDGVVATVNRKPVLRSQWDEAVRFEAFMHQKRLADVSEQERFAALKRLIDRELLD